MEKIDLQMQVYFSSCGSNLAINMRPKNVIGKKNVFDSPNQTPIIEANHKIGNTLLGCLGFRKYDLMLLHIEAIIINSNSKKDM